MSEEELKQRLFYTVSAIFGFVIFMILALSLFGTKIGALFGFISKYRNDEMQKVVLNLAPPIFSNAPNSTNKEKVNLSGSAQPGTTVVLFVNGPEKGRTTAGEDATFTFIDVELLKGRNTIFAKTQDKDGKESQKSADITITFDKDKPKLEMISPKEGETIKNLNERVQVSGKVNEKATIKINEKTAPQKPDHSFEFLLGVKEGNVKIDIVATDEAGNEAKETINIVYQKDSE